MAGWGNNNGRTNFRAARERRMSETRWKRWESRGKRRGRRRRLDSTIRQGRKKAGDPEASWEQRENVRGRIRERRCRRGKRGIIRTLVEAQLGQ